MRIFEALGWKRPETRFAIKKSPGYKFCKFYRSFNKLKNKERKVYSKIEENYLRLNTLALQNPKVGTVLPRTEDLLKDLSKSQQRRVIVCFWRYRQMILPDKEFFGLDEKSANEYLTRYEREMAHYRDLHLKRRKLSMIVGIFIGWDWDDVKKHEIPRMPLPRGHVTN